MGEVELPVAVSGDYPFEVLSGGEGVVVVGVLGSGLVGDEAPDVSAVDLVGREFGSGQAGEGREEIDGGEGSGGDGSWFDLAGVAGDAGAADASVEAGGFGFAIGGLAGVVAVGGPGAVIGGH